MTENKRFNRVGGYVYDGERCVSHFNDPKHREEIVKLLNSLSEENEQLKKELFEARRDYLIETADISDKPYLDDEIEKERREIFGDVE